MGAYETDTDTLEMIRDRMKTILSGMEETYGVLRQIYNQMLTEIGFDGFPQWGSAVGACEAAMQGAGQLSRRMESLKGVLEKSPDAYAQLEREHIQAIQRMNTRMNSLQAGFAAVMSASYPLGVEEGEAGSAAGALERQTADAVLELEIANVMAITKVLEEEYHFDRVEPVPGMTFVPPADEAGKDDDEE